MQEITFKEVELTRIKLEPGEVLTIKVFSDDGDSSYLDSFRQKIQEYFPNNKVLTFLFPTGNNMTIETIKPVIETKDCSTGNYCADCNCGKKEASEKGPETFTQEDYA